MNGTVQQALTLIQALPAAHTSARLLSVGPCVATVVKQAANVINAEVLEADSVNSSDADLTIVLGLWDRGSAETAARLLSDGRRVVLAPTLYWQDETLAKVACRAAALWFVSWDQALRARSSWKLAERVEVVRCVVDTKRFRPSSRPEGGALVLCRHSRAAPEKFAPNVIAILDQLRAAQPVILSMLGMCGDSHILDPRVRILPQGSVDPALFPRRGYLGVCARRLLARDGLRGDVGGNGVRPSGCSHERGRHAGILAPRSQWIRLR
jgi:hypothetical protein